MFTIPEGERPHAPSLIAPDDAEVVFYFAEPTMLSGETTLPATESVDQGLDESTSTVGLPCPLHTTLRSLGRWLLVLLSMVFVAALLGSVGAARRPLPLAAMAVRQPARPVPLVERLLVLACLWSPMLMLLGLLQAEREMLSSVLLCMAVTGAVSAAVMLASRRRLYARLCWALEGRLNDQPDGVMVKAEVDPKRLVAPPGEKGPTPWFRADLIVNADESGPARVSLDGVVVDDEAARTLVRMAMGLSPMTRLTVLGAATRAPADAAGAQPLDRMAATQARISHGEAGRTLLVGGSPLVLARRLRSESLLLAAALFASLSAAFLTLLS